jgi:phosphate acyltransferase
MVIGIDIMGGDFAPVASLVGANIAINELPDSVELVLIGEQQKIEKVADEKSIDLSKFSVQHTPNMIQMGEHPLRSFSHKKNSSIVTGFKMLAAGKLDAFCSAGNTGAMMVGGVQVINSVPGVIRPGIAAEFPNLHGSTSIVIDVGLNPDCKPDVLYQYGIIGSIYSNNVLKINNPRVALLNIGTEEEKGNLLTKAAYQSMKGSNDFNFVGNIESNDFLTADKADVIVCDGFVGNVILKFAENFYSIISKRNITDGYFNSFNFQIYGGAPILGIKKPVIIGHGISNETAIKNMILKSKDVVEAKIAEKITKLLDNNNQH